MEDRLGEYLRTVRKLCGMTLRAAERKTGISNAYLSQLETGRAENPSPHLLYKLAELYQIPYESLMEKAGYLRQTERRNRGAQRSTALQKALLSAKLTEEEQQKVAEFIGYLRSQRK